MRKENQPTSPCQQQLPNTIWYLQLQPPDTWGREQPETLQKVAVATGELGEPTTAAYYLNQSHNTGVLLSLPETQKEVVQGEGNEQPLKPPHHIRTLTDAYVTVFQVRLAPKS